MIWNLCSSTWDMLRAKTILLTVFDHCPCCSWFATEKNLEIDPKRHYIIQSSIAMALLNWYFISKRWRRPFTKDFLLLRGVLYSGNSARWALALLGECCDVYTFKYCPYHGIGFRTYNEIGHTAWGILHFLFNTIIYSRSWQPHKPI